MQEFRRPNSQVFFLQLKSFLFLYFLQGIPYGLQTRFLPVHLRSIGMSLTNLGYFRMLLAPWVLKGLWAPIIDSSGDLRMWLNASHISLIVLSLMSSQFPPYYFVTLGVILFLTHLSVAVQDISLDGLLIELLTPSQLVVGNMVQVVGYKVGSIFSGGFFGFLAEAAGWDVLFYIITLMYSAGYVVSAFCLPIQRNYNGAVTPVREVTAESEVSPESEAAANRAMSRSMSMAGFDDTNRMPLELDNRNERISRRSSILRLLDIEGTRWLLLFVFVYKFGDQGVATLFPMFMIDSGLDIAEVAFWSGFMGQIFSLAGSIISGLFTKSMIESIQVLIAVQAVCLVILWLVVVFWNNSDAMYAGSMFVLMIAYFASGGVTTCTFTLIMQLSQRVPRRYRTSHYTLLATSEVAGRLVAGSFSGVLTDGTSYVFTFGLLAAISVIILPCMMLVPAALIIEA